MVAEPCVSPYTGACHIGSCDRCEELDGAASTMFRQMDLEEFSTPDGERGGDEENFGSALGMFTLSGDESEYINSVFESETMHWLNHTDLVAQPRNSSEA